MSVKITFLGTSSGETSRTRNHSSIFVKSAYCNLLIDCGDGIAKALLNQGIDYNSINCILLTHHHADHFAGIPSLITQMKINKQTLPVGIFTQANLINNLEQFLISSYLFKEKLGFELNLIPFEFGTVNKICPDISFTSERNSHITYSQSLEKYSPEIFVSSSVLLKFNSTNVLYTSDIGLVDDLFLFKNEKIDTVISESTHVEIDALIEALLKINPDKILLTHYSDDMANVLNTKCKNLRPAEQERIKICYDGMSINLN